MLTKLDEDADMAVDVSMTGLEMTNVGDGGGESRMKPLYLNDSSVFRTPRNATESNGIDRIETTGDIGVVELPSTGIFRVPMHPAPKAGPRANESPSLLSGSVRFLNETVDNLYLSEESG